MSLQTLPSMTKVYTNGVVKVNLIMAVKVKVHTNMAVKVNM